MTLANKIRGAMHLKGVSHKDLAKALGIQPTALSAKFYRDSFSSTDLILIADTLGFELCFVDDVTKITFDKTNLLPKKE